MAGMGFEQSVSSVRASFDETSKRPAEDGFMTATAASLRRQAQRSWTRVMESRRLLLFVLQRRLRLAEMSRDRARAKGRSASASTHLRESQANLIERASATAARLAKVAPLLSPEARFAAAVEVQKLDELIIQWSKAGASAKRPSRDLGL
jgi:erythromycin esterase-like protein